jgi:hypothetical protein
MKLSNCKAGDVVFLPLDENFRFTMDSNEAHWKAGRFVKVTILKDGGDLIGWKRDKRNIGHCSSGKSSPIITSTYKKLYPHLSHEVFINNYVPCYLAPPTNNKKAEFPILFSLIAASLIGASAIIPSSKHKDMNNET